MTAKKGLKKRVRARQAKTGERYTEALAAMRGGKGPVPKRPVVEEWHRIDEVLAAAGLRCAGIAGGALWSALGEPESGGLRAVVDTLRRALQVTSGDPAFVLLRQAILEGEPLAATLDLDELVASRRAFVERLRAGLRGVSPDGCALAFDVELKRRTHLVIASLGRTFTSPTPREHTPMPELARRWLPPNPCVFLSLGSAWMGPTLGLEVSGLHLP